MTRIFISHSHVDQKIAYELVGFLMVSLELQERNFFYSSNADRGLEFKPSSITDQLKQKLQDSQALVLLITADSLDSDWILFEVGSFWTTSKPIVPILGSGLKPGDLPGPLSNLLSISIDNQNFHEKFNGAVNQLAVELGIEPVWTERRQIELGKFTTELKAWKSQRSATAKQQIKALKTQLEESEKKYRQQIEQKEAVFQQA